MTENNTKSKSIISIINAVQTPLGLFTLISLILEVIFLTMAAVTEEVPLLVPILVLALLILCLTTIVIIKPDALKPTRDLIIHFDFTDPFNVDFDGNKCILMIKDRKNKLKHKENFNPFWDHSGWNYYLPDNVNPTDSVNFSLIDTTGRTWRIRPFLPRTINKKPLKHS